MVVVKSQVLSHATGNDQNNGRLLACAHRTAPPRTLHRAGRPETVRARTRLLAHLTHRLQLLCASQCSGQYDICRETIQ